MLAREQQHHGDFICFYHSYSFAALLYECQSEIARTVYGLPSDFAPLPRLLHEPYHTCPTMHDLKHTFQNGMSGQDHHPAFRAVAISASCSLNAFGSEAPPLNCFQHGYSCSDLSFRGLLDNLLRTLSVSGCTRCQVEGGW